MVATKSSKDDYSSKVLYLYCTIVLFNEFIHFADIKGKSKIGFVRIESMFKTSTDIEKRYGY
jgi:hypothetical protein